MITAHEYGIFGRCPASDYFEIDTYITMLFDVSLLMLSFAAMSSFIDAEKLSADKQNDERAFELLLAEQSRLEQRQSSESAAVSFGDLPPELHDLIVNLLPTHKDKLKYKAVNRNSRNVVESHYNHLNLDRLLEKPLAFNASREDSINEAAEDVKTVMKLLSEDYYKNETFFFRLAEWTDPIMQEPVPQKLGNLLDRLRADAKLFRFLTMQRKNQARKWQLDGWLDVSELTPRQRWQRARNWSQLSILSTSSYLNDRHIFNILGYPALDVTDMPSVYSLQYTVFYRSHGYEKIMIRLLKERFKPLLGLNGNNNRLDMEIMFFMHLYYVHEPMNTHGYSPAVSHFVLGDLMMQYVKAIVSNERHLPQTVSCVEFILGLIVMVEEGYYPEYKPYIRPLIEKWYKTRVPEVFPLQTRQSVLLAGALDAFRLDVVVTILNLMQDYIHEDNGFISRYANISLILDSPEYKSIENVLHPLQLYVAAAS